MYQMMNYIFLNSNIIINLLILD